MQDVLTTAIELTAIAFTTFVAIDFALGLLTLLPETAPVARKQGQQEFPEDAIKFYDVFNDIGEVTNGNADMAHETITDPWDVEVEIEIVLTATTTETQKPVLLLPPARMVAQQPANDYSGWTIRALKKEASSRKIKGYSNMTKDKLITALS